MNETTFKVRFLDKDITSIYILEDSTADACIKTLMEFNGTLAIDTETMPLPQYRDYPKAGLSPHLATIRLIQIYDGKQSYVFDLMFIKRRKKLIKLLETKKFLAHNAVFDYKFLRKLGAKHIELGCTRIIYKLISHAVYPTDAGLSASLEALCSTILKSPIYKDAQTSDWGEPNLTFEQVEYSAVDPIAVWELGKRFKNGINKFNLWKIYKLTKEAQYPICEMQLNGVGLDVDKHTANIHAWRDKLYASKKILMEHLGTTRITDTKIREWLGANLDPYTLSFWPVTETSGQLSVSASTFSDYEHLEIVKPLTIFKKFQTLCNTFGDQLINCVNPETGRIHSDFNICGARTGRLSSSKPNLQNFPRSTIYRQVFIPAKGKILVLADFSQIEVRVAGEYSQDKVLLDAYRNGSDIYSITAAHLSGKHISEVQSGSPERQNAKALVLGLMYGLGANSFCSYAKKGYGVEVSQEKASKDIKEFRKLYHSLRSWQLDQTAMCQESLIATTKYGKIRCLAADNWYGSSLNTPIQGTASEINLQSMVNCYHKIKGTDIKMFNNIHDEIVLECSKDLKNDAIKVLKDSMTDAYLQCFPDGVVNNLVQPSWGYNWGEAK